MTRNERIKIAKTIIKVIDHGIEQIKVMAPQVKKADKVQKRKIFRDVLNHYINIKYVPEKAEGLAIEKVVGFVMDYLDKKLCKEKRK